MNLKSLGMGIVLLSTVVPSLYAHKKTQMSKKEIILKTAVNSSAIILGLCTMYAARYTNAEAAARLVDKPKEPIDILDEQALYARYDKEQQEKIMIYHHLDHALDKMKLGALFVLYGLYGFGDTYYSYKRSIAS